MIRGYFPARVLPSCSVGEPLFVVRLRVVKSTSSGRRNARNVCHLTMSITVRAPLFAVNRTYIKHLITETLSKHISKVNSQQHLNSVLLAKSQATQTTQRYGEWNINDLDYLCYMPVIVSIFLFLFLPCIHKTKLLEFYLKPPNLNFQKFWCCFLFYSQMFSSSREKIF